MCVQEGQDSELEVTCAPCCALGIKMKLTLESDLERQKDAFGHVCLSRSVGHCWNDSTTRLATTLWDWFDIRHCRLWQYGHGVHSPDVDPAYWRLLWQTTPWGGWGEALKVHVSSKATVPARRCPGLETSVHDEELPGATLGLGHPPGVYGPFDYVMSSSVGSGDQEASAMFSWDCRG